MWFETMSSGPLTPRRFSRPRMAGFANNMVAGHVMMEVFASFLVLMASAGAVGIFAAIFPQLVNIILIGFELLVAALQAYVFALLTCLYLHDAVHLH